MPHGFAGTVGGGERSQPELGTDWPEVGQLRAAGPWHRSSPRHRSSLRLGTLVRGEVCFPAPNKYQTEHSENRAWCRFPRGGQAAWGLGKAGAPPGQAGTRTTEGPAGAGWTFAFTC